MVGIVLIEIDLKLDAWYIYSYLLRKIYWWTRKLYFVSYNREWVFFLCKHFTIFLPLVEGKARIFPILKSPFDMKFWFPAAPQNFLALALFGVVLWVLVYFQYKEYMKTVYPSYILVIHSNQWNQLSFKCSKSFLVSIAGSWSFPVEGQLVVTIYTPPSGQVGEFAFLEHALDPGCVVSVCPSPELAAAGAESEFKRTQGASIICVSCHPIDCFSIL